MILLFLISLGILIFLIGIWKRKAIYGKVFIGVGVLLIGIFFFGPFRIFYSCEKYSNDLRNVLQKINKPCENNDDCELISYFPCKPYCINKEADLSAFYSLNRKRPWSCPLYRCIVPEVKWRCVCENNTCAVKEKEVIEEVIKDETANWKTYKNEEYGFEFKYPEGWYIEERSGDKVSTPWFTLFEVILNEKRLIEHERPLISIYIQNENFVLGTRDWQDFKVGQVDGKIACDVLGCEIILPRIRNQTFYILTKNNPLFDTITNQMLSTFRFLE
jgi:hypothetical protein